ncbi:DMT family transporter [Arcicella sp. LKC2W]|uniref:DMT family transporter n=1 Tax=Arcicella sp. LKC2W TaxID=2984198 RepID=UPI002B20D6F5|nr:DMT family transporter [Arcicella sp. LKC2W]MEA5459664.1 DMT family transporter [Arcicella sp. LKC2W]
MQYFLIFLAFLCGAVFPTQAALNTQMTKNVGHPVLAAFLSFFTGLIALFLYILIARIPLQSLSSARNVPWYVWFAGLLGAFYISTVIVLIPRLGFALTFGLIVAGQMAISLLFDHYGILHTPIREISIGRIIGALFLVAGVILIRKF